MGGKRPEGSTSEEGYPLGHSAMAAISQMLETVAYSMDTHSRVGRSSIFIAFWLADLKARAG